MLEKIIIIIFLFNLRQYNNIIIIQQQSSVHYNNIVRQLVQIPKINKGRETQKIVCEIYQCLKNAWKIQKSQHCFDFLKYYFKIFEQYQRQTIQIKRLTIQMSKNHNLFSTHFISQNTKFKIQNRVTQLTFFKFLSFQVNCVTRDFRLSVFPQYYQWQNNQCVFVSQVCNVKNKTKFFTHRTVIENNYVQRIYFKMKKMQKLNFIQTKYSNHKKKVLNPTMQQFLLFMLLLNNYYMGYHDHLKHHLIKTTHEAFN
eukprot:TRINITY_DN25014_c0_g1_i2.p1 TRINITY_DN25014_c0_g1~~TRINITY_DN25014_c0_g1_i2.p1  ORF type:complete len:255 (-),score=-11.94 TRINITY_DN25014_c0_g1_i2:46-810(-)